MFRKKRQKRKLFKRYDSKNIFPWIGKYQLRHSCWLPFSRVWKLLLPLRKNCFNEKQFGAERFPQKTAHWSESAGLQPVKEFLLRDQLFTAQTQKTNKSFLHFKSKSTKWTCGHVERRLGTLPRFLREKSGEFLPKIREQFWEFRVLNGLKLFRSKFEKIFEKKILPKNVQNSSFGFVEWSSGNIGVFQLLKSESFFLRVRKWWKKFFSFNKNS